MWSSIDNEQENQRERLFASQYFMAATIDSQKRQTARLVEALQMQSVCVPRCLGVGGGNRPASAGSNMTDFCLLLTVCFFNNQDFHSIN